MRLWLSPLGEGGSVLPPLSQREKELEPLLGRALEELADIVQLLHNKLEVSQRAVAVASDVNPGYLSQLLDPTNGKKNPSLQMIRKLTRGVAAVVDDRRADLHRLQLADDVEEVLAGVEERFNLERPQRSGPGGVIGAEAATYIPRACDIVAEKLVSVPGEYLISGPPSSGRSSLAHRVAFLAEERGQQVALIDLDSWVDEGPASDLDLARALVSNLTPDRGTIDGWADVEEALSTWLLAGGRQASVLVVDNGNAGLANRVNALLKLVRGWHNKRSSASLPGNSAFRNLSTWLVATSDAVRDARYTSWANVHGGLKLVTTWFARDEVSALAGAYLPSSGGKAQAAVAEAATRARALFGGQPRLTHHLLHDRSLGLEEAIELTKPESVYQDHLERLAALIRLDEESHEALRKADEVGPSRVTRHLENLEVVRDRDRRDWSCLFYRDNLSRLFS